jgi:hypothetical protein
MRCSYYPQSLVQICGAIGRSGVGFGGIDPRVLFIPSCPGTTSLTGVSLLRDLSWVFCWTRVSLGRVGATQFLSSLDVFALFLWRVLILC